MVSPYFQREGDFYLKFQYDNSLEGFKLIYRGKEIKFSYKIDSEGRIAFEKNLKKKNLYYVDGKKLKFIHRLRVINYFDKWLKDNELLSSEV